MNALQEAHAAVNAVFREWNEQNRQCRITLETTERLLNAWNRLANLLDADYPDAAHRERLQIAAVMQSAMLRKLQGSEP